MNTPEFINGIFAHFKKFPDGGVICNVDIKWADFIAENQSKVSEKGYLRLSVKEKRNPVEGKNNAYIVLNDYVGKNVPPAENNAPQATTEAQEQAPSWLQTPPEDLGFSLDEIPF